MLHSIYASWKVFCSQTIVMVLIILWIINHIHILHTFTMVHVLVIICLRWQEFHNLTSGFVEGILAGIKLGENTAFWKRVHMHYAYIYQFTFHKEVCFYFLYLISKSQSNMLWVKSSLNFAIQMLLFAKTFQNICSALYSFDEQFADIYWWWLNISHCAWGRHDYVGAELCTFNYCYVILV